MSGTNRINLQVLLKDVNHVSEGTSIKTTRTKQQMFEAGEMGTTTPQDIAAQLATVGQGRERSTRQDADLALPRIRSESGRKRFLYRAVSAFNSLPVAVREQPPGAFKRNVKRRLGHF